MVSAVAVERSMSIESTAAAETPRVSRTMEAKSVWSAAGSVEAIARRPSSASAACCRAKLCIRVPVVGPVPSGCAMTSLLQIQGGRFGGLSAPGELILRAPERGEQRRSRLI